MKRNIITVLAILFSCFLYAQKKDGVVVFGATPAGIAAAIQSAHSGAKTTLVYQGGFPPITLSEADKASREGIYGDLLKRVDSLSKKSGSTKPGPLTSEYTSTVFKSWMDTIKNLRVIQKSELKEVNRDGKTWEAEFKDKSELKAEVFIDATAGSLVAGMAKVPLPKGPSPSGNELYTNKLYRTGVAPRPGVAGTVALSELIAGIDNFLIVGTNSSNSSIYAGQAAGATGAYCSFFNTNTKNLNIRIIQGELFLYRSQLLSFADVPASDSAYVNIQKLALSGVLKLKAEGNQFFFMPDSLVSSEEIKGPIREYYSRSQIWFLDNKVDRLSVGDVLSLIKFTASRGKELDTEVERAWNTSLRLNGKFDVKRMVTRKELAVLLETYMKPFARNIDLEGNFKF